MPAAAAGSWRMRRAVISDIHANLEALQAVLERIKEQEVEEILCLGDSVGYNADPNECLDILRSMNVTCVLGNHDASAAGLEEPEDFNPLALTAVLWTRERLTPDNKQFLADLPRERKSGSLLLFHGAIHDTDRYLLYREDAVENFRLLAETPEVTIGFFGHTHIRAALSSQKGVISFQLVPEELKVQSGHHYLINPGSVGQPRDGDPRASFLVYDDRRARITFHRVAYDIRACQEKILRAGLPPQLAERLAWGW
jgi:predicted phosphodiesterase